MGNVIYLVFGIFFLIAGFVSLVAKALDAKWLFAKEERYKRFWGQTFGAILHFVSYVIVPIVVGVAMILMYFEIIPALF
jgi:uncharacterized membrane protein YraQ (UPF0718 family)